MFAGRCGSAAMADTGLRSLSWLAGHSNCCGDRWRLLHHQKGTAVLCYSSFRFNLILTLIVGSASDPFINS